MTSLRPPPCPGAQHLPRDRSDGGRRRALAVTAAALWIASVGGPKAQTTPDNGGNLQAYIADVARLNRDGAAKRLAGRCASACTIYLGVRRVCVAPAAELWFHAAFLPNGRKDAAGSLLMLSYYPDAVRAWAIRVGALEQVAWSAQHRLTAAQLIQMGVPQCRDG